MKETIDITALHREFANIEKPMPKQCGLELIAQERIEQVAKHGYSPLHDVKYVGNNRLLAAANAILNSAEISWPMEDWYWKQIMAKPRAEQLAVAGAFIAADIDRQHYTR